MIRNTCTEPPGWAPRTFNWHYDASSPFLTVEEPHSPEPSEPGVELYHRLGPWSEHDYELRCNGRIMRMASHDIEGLAREIKSMDYIHDGMGFFVGLGGCDMVPESPRIYLSLAPYLREADFEKTMAGSHNLASVFLAEVRRISGGYSPGGEPELAWQAIVWNLLTDPSNRVCRVNLTDGREISAMSDMSLPSEKERFARGYSSIKYTCRGARYLVERHNHGPINIYASCGLDPAEEQSFWLASRANLNQELYRLSAPYSPNRDPDHAWAEIVWNLFHGGCDSIDDYVCDSVCADRYPELFSREYFCKWLEDDWEDTAPKTQEQPEPEPDTPPQELLDYLDELVKTGHSDGNSTFDSTFREE